VTLITLSDDVFGDLLDVGNGLVSNSTCATEPRLIPMGGSFTCSFDADLVGNVGDPDHVNTVTATVDDGEGRLATDSDSATVGFGDTAPSIAVSKTPSVGSVSEPGGTVTFTVEVENTSVESIVLTDLDDDVFGDLLDPTNPDVDNNTCETEPTLIGVGVTFTCVFDGNVDGIFGDPDHVNTVTATVDDGEGNIGTGSDDATVTFDDVPPTLNVWKIADPGSVPEPGATVTFTVEVDNTSREEVSVTALTDDVFGDLLDPLNTDVSNNSCLTASPVIGVAETFTCSFDAFLAGDHGDPDHVNTVSATVDDGDGSTETASGTETVPFDAADGTLTGHLFIDSDGDGFQDVGEPDLQGVDVIIIDADGITYTVTSGVDGDWSVDVALGDAALAVDLLTVPSGYELTTANDTQTGTVSAGGTASDPIGYRPEPASLSGTVFLDLNGDGVRTYPEPGLAGVTVDLVDASGVQIDTTTTNADGGYGFGGLPPGTYTVEVDESTIPAGLVISGDPDAVLDAETTGTLEAGDDEDDLDFAYEGTGSIGDTVWLDEDEDGVEDAGEDPIAGVVVELRWAGFDGVFGTSDDWVFPVEVTGSDGRYRFWDLPPGEYRVAVDLDTVFADLAPTTPVSVDVDLGPGEEFDDGDVGFSLGPDEPLPQTGIEAETLGLWGIISTAAGLLLLLLGRRRGRREEIRWDRV
jgi:LPXTG-motif cell wall-anchored protein